METIIPECEIIGNPKMHAESDTKAHNPVSNGISQHTTVPSTNRSVPKNLSNSTQTFRPTVQPAYQPPPVYKNHGSIMKNEAPARIIPIAALNPYQGRWAVKARVTAKGDLRRYNNAKGDGKVFSFDLLDSDGGEIRVYIISKGSLKPAKKNFNHLNNEWEIFLESSSTIDLCPDEDSSIPQQQFSFKPIMEIETAENNSIIDVIGIVTSVKPCVPVLRKNGMETQKRDLNLKDQSGRSVELTLWGSSVIVKVKNFKNWSILIKDEGLGRSDKADWVTVKATITFIKTDNFCYTACPLTIGDKQCTKKVTKSGSSKWQCDRCNQEFEECDYRYLLQCQVQDHTGLTWVTAFQEAGEEILGCSAKELYMMKSEGDDERFGNVIKIRLFGEVL
ncbi:putative replication protein A, OB [Helianthus annuus]|nr:putative replication protein A, OB [Helianthus annuus]